MQFFSKQDCPVVPTHILLLTVKVVVTQSCLTLCNPMDCSLPSSSVHGILHARILESVDTAFSRGIFLTQGSNLGLLHCRQILYHLRHPENTVFFLNWETSRLCLDFPSLCCSRNSPAPSSGTLGSHIRKYSLCLVFSSV